MTASHRKPATMADLEALPPHVKGEIIDGVLHTQPRPRAWHQEIASLLDADIKNPYGRGRGGPGGWWILVEPGIEVPGSAEFSPDLAGWRKERMPTLPVDRSIDVVPDWACEILSPTTRGYDQRIKRPFYARIGIQWLWFIDLEARTHTTSRLAEGRWLELAVFADDERVRAEPFDGIELTLTECWPPQQQP